MTMPTVIRFGIRSLDRLIGTVDGDKRLYGIGLSEPTQIKDNKRTSDGLPMTASVCLSGPDGSGKSVFSLHMASHYLGDCLSECLSSTARKRNCSVPRVLYISTDLTYKMALKGWDQFALNLPIERREPLVELREGRKERGSQPRLEI